MTVSKCLQLIMYGVIAGYETPRMLSKFTRPKLPDYGREQAKLGAIYREPYPGLQCNPGEELETPSQHRIREIVDQAKKLGL